MVPAEGALQQIDDSTGEQKGHTEHAAQHQREEQHEIEAALENVGPEDGHGDKADDGARPVPDRMESHPLVAVGAVAGGDIGRGAGQDGSLLPGYKGLAGLQAAGVVKAQTISVIDSNDVNTRKILVQGIQRPGDLLGGIAIRQHLRHAIHRGHIGGGAGDGGVDALTLAGDIEIEGDPQREHQ